MCPLGGDPIIPYTGFTNQSSYFPLFNTGMKRVQVNPGPYKKLLQLLLTNDFSNEKTIYSKTIYERQTSQQSSKAG